MTGTFTKPFPLVHVPICDQTHGFLLGQWLNFKLFGITYLVGKTSRSKLFFCQGPGRLSEALVNIPYKKPAHLGYIRETTLFLKVSTKVCLNIPYKNSAHLVNKGNNFFP